MTALQLQTLTFPVTGMTCASCAASVESMVGAQKGVDKAEVNYASQSVKVAFHPDLIQPDLRYRKWKPLTRGGSAKQLPVIED
jgi:Cu2+-exporting ATPase